MHFLFPFLLSLPIVQTRLLDIRYPQFFHLSPGDSALEISEGKASGTFIAFLTILNGTFDDWALNCSDDDFHITFNGLAFSLITRTTLDRERRDFYQLIITARHLLFPFETLSRTVRLRILDLNDSPPIFNQSIYRATLGPNRPTFTVRAFDADQPATENSRISYSLANYQNLFRINETTGTIECVKTSFPSPSERYEVIVQARDHGKPPLSSSTLVQIQLHRPSAPRSTSRLFVEQRPENILIVLAAVIVTFLFVCLLTCLICSIRSNWQRRCRRRGKPIVHLYLPENVNSPASLPSASSYI